MASRTKAELETLVKRQQEVIRNLQGSLEEGMTALDRARAEAGHHDRKPPRLRILELPSEWISRDPDKTRSPFVLVIDRAPNDVVDLDAIAVMAEDIGAQGVLAFREAIQLGEDWEQEDE